jgi:hypothetical protein
MSWMSAICTQRDMLMREAMLVGATMARIAMRYMWSEIDSPFSMPTLAQPVRLVVFSRSMRWKKGTGEVMSCAGRCGIVESTAGDVN